MNEINSTLISSIDSNARRLISLRERWSSFSPPNVSVLVPASIHSPCRGRLFSETLLTFRSTKCSVPLHAQYITRVLSCVLPEGVACEQRTWQKWISSSVLFSSCHTWLFPPPPTEGLPRPHGLDVVYTMWEVGWISHTSVTLGTPPPH